MEKKNEENLQENNENDVSQNPLTPSSGVFQDDGIFEKAMMNNFEKRKSKTLDNSDDDDKKEGIKLYELNQFLFPHDDDVDEEDYIFRIPGERYKPIKIIGEGAYGIVVSAYDKKLEKNVAIKKIKNVFKQTREYQKRILREILLLKHLKTHDNIVELIDLIAPIDLTSFNDIYIVTDLMDIDLSRLLKKKKKLSEDQIQYMMYQVIRGLKYIHSAKVLHRDIKPSNILINRKMDVKLCDFGLSRGIDFDIKMSTHYVVTRYYRAPELLLMWEKTSCAIDMWSAGCIFAELLSLLEYSRRKILFKGSGWIDQLQKIIDTVGTPKEDEIFGSQSAMKYMRKLRKKGISVKKDWNIIFTAASKNCLDLLDKLLQFNPHNRITSSDALKHKYFSEFVDEDDDDEEEEQEECVKPFDFRFSEMEDVPTQDIKYEMFKIVSEWNQEKNGYIEDFEVTLKKDIIKIKKK